MTRNTQHITGKNRYRQQVWLGLILMMVFSGPSLILASGEKNDSIPLAAGMAVNKSQSLMEQDKPDQALAVLIRYSEKLAEPVHFYIDFLTGICHTELGQTGEAAAAFQRAVDKNRTCPRPGSTWPGAGMNRDRWPWRPGL